MAEDDLARRHVSARPSRFGIAWAGFMTLIISPVMVFDVLTIVHWRQDKAIAFITLPLLAAALWAFWATAFAKPSARRTRMDATEGGRPEVVRERQQRHRRSRRPPEPQRPAEPPGR